MAMDQGDWPVSGWASEQVRSALVEGVTFLGYAHLATLAQRPEYRRVVEIIAAEMTREWIEFTATSTDSDAQDKTDRIAELEDEFDRLQVCNAFRVCAEYDGFYGRAHLFVDLAAGRNNREELATPIGCGADPTTKAKLRKGQLLALRPVEPVWCYPTEYNSSDPLRDDWYNPTLWYALSRQVHATRLLKFVGRPVPDMLKPAYSFGGLALTQMAKPYVDNWLRTRQSVSDLIHSFSVFVLETDLSSALGADGSELWRRIDIFNQTRDNRGLMVTQTGTEKLENISAPLSGLDALQAQSQEQICVAGDTLIETQRGQVPIAQLTASDLVMTRQGLAPLRWVGITGHSADLVTIGGRLRATPCHPIFLPQINAFAPAQHVKPTDRLAESPAWANTAKPSFGAAAFGAEQRPATTATSRPAGSCIVRSGLPTAARLLTNWIFTTAMKIATTIGWTIWNWSRAQSTYECTFCLAGSASTPSLNFSQSVARVATASIGPSGRADPSIAAPPATPPPGGRAEPVYNLQVADGYPPEFYADGILTHNCSITGIPLVKYTGISPHGLNASSEGELRVFYDWIKSYQEKLFRAQLTTIMQFAMRNIWGEVDEEINFHFKPLWALDEKGAAELRKLDAEAGQILVDTGVIHQEEERARVAGDPRTPYPALDVEDVPDLLEEEMEGLAPRGGGGGLKAILGQQGPQGPPQPGKPNGGGAAKPPGREMKEGGGGQDEAVLPFRRRD
jgi:hypothetical protein